MAGNRRGEHEIVPIACQPTTRHWPWEKGESRENYTKNWSDSRHHELSLVQRTISTILYNHLCDQKASGHIECVSTECN